MDDVKSASLTIEANDQKLSEVDLKITPVEQLEGSNKEYRIENASISNSMMRLGTLKAASDDVIKEYPTVSLEYRYLKDKMVIKKIMIIMWYLKRLLVKVKNSSMVMIMGHTILKMIVLKIRT